MSDPARGGSDGRDEGEWSPDWWWHEKHGLHDGAHHQHHEPLHLCVPLSTACPPSVLRRRAEAAEARLRELREAVTWIEGVLGGPRGDEPYVRGQVLGRCREVLAPPDAAPQRDWEAHPGMVTVYDEKGRYLGCMGRLRWEQLLRDDGPITDVWPPDTAPRGGQT